MVTLQDIADRCDVSTVTVSNVLRGKVKGSWPSSAARAERVRQVARELGYRVDWRARALKTKRTYMVGMLSTDKPQTHWIEPRVTTPLMEGLGEAGYHVAFVRVGQQEQVSDFADARFDGLVIDYHVEPEELKIIEQSKTPIVIINAPSPAPDHAVSIMPDHYAMGRLAAEELLKLGHRRIGLVEGSEAEQIKWPSHMYDMWRRGIRDALKDAGEGENFVRMVPESIPEDTESTEAYRDMLAATLKGKNPPTAVIVNNPIRAATKVLANLEKLGIRCPEDVSLLTMENIAELQWCRPKLSAVEVGFARLGKLAAQQLLSMIDANVAADSNATEDQAEADKTKDGETPAETAARFSGVFFPRESVRPLKP
ncbi:MAG: LacI family DNA-binding transcriptional regulator [Planctomycetota bacterium]